MYFVLLGVLFLVLKLASVSPVHGWPWWAVLLPFGLAAAWWAFADATGYSKRREMRKLDEKAASRRERNLNALKPESKSRRPR